jgi:putative flippase GtrA
LSLTETEEIQAPEELSSKTQDTDNHRFPRWRSTFWQFLRFCLVGGVNTLIDLLVLNILLWRFPTHNVQVLVVYNSVAYTSGAVSSFFLNKYWTFRRRQRPTRREVVRFALSLCFEILYSSGLVLLAGKALQPVITNPTLWGNASKLLAVACGTVISYACMRFWTFASVSRDRPEKQETFHRRAAEPGNRAASNVTEHDHHHAESERA